jgi:hypothetical protein
VTAPKPTAKPQPNRTCRACSQPVIGARTEARSKWIALDPIPDPKGNQAAFQDSDGTWKTRQLGKGERPWDWETVLMPHVATCPKQPPEPVKPPPLPPNVIKFDPARRRGINASRKKP